MPLARHMADAYAAFSQAAMVTPDSLPGIAGRRLAASCVASCRVDGDVNECPRIGGMRT
ncbi:MAG: hypothetical protein P8M32_00535 [Phycisphaerales bacterium]|nr:hypothetical protein [Phycisphaerales bacterium]